MAGRPTAPAMAKPENQVLVLNYIRNNGKKVGMGSAIGLHDSAVEKFITRNPSFAARCRLAMDQHLNGEVDDFQVHWNHNAKQYNEAVMGRVLQLILEGDNTLEVKRRYKPVYDEKGEPVMDENGEQKLQLVSVEEREVNKSTPQYIINMGIELMLNRHNQPEMLKISPILLLRFIRFVQREGIEIRGEAMKELVGLASSFDDELKKEMLMLTAKPRSL